MEGRVDEACGFKRASAITTIKDRPRMYRKRAPVSRLWSLLQLLLKSAFSNFVPGASFSGLFVPRVLLTASAQCPQLFHAPSCFYRASTMRSPRMLGSIHLLGCQFSGQRVSTGVMEYILLSGNERAHLGIAEIEKGSWVTFPWTSLLIGSLLPLFLVNCVAQCLPSARPGLTRVEHTCYPAIV